MKKHISLCALKNLRCVKESDMNIIAKNYLCLRVK